MDLIFLLQILVDSKETFFSLINSFQVLILNS